MGKTKKEQILTSPCDGICIIEVKKLKVFPFDMFDVGVLVGACFKVVITVLVVVFRY